MKGLIMYALIGGAHDKETICLDQELYFIQLDIKSIPKFTIPDEYEEPSNIIISELYIRKQIWQKSKYGGTNHFIVYAIEGMSEKEIMHKVNTDWESL